MLHNTLSPFLDIGSVENRPDGVGNLDDVNQSESLPAKKIIHVRLDCATGMENFIRHRR